MLNQSNQFVFLTSQTKSLLYGSVKVKSKSVIVSLNQLNEITSTGCFIPCTLKKLPLGCLQRSISKITPKTLCGSPCPLSTMWIGLATLYPPQPCFIPILAHYTTLSAFATIFLAALFLLLLMANKFCHTKDSIYSKSSVTSLSSSTLSLALSESTSACRFRCAAEYSKCHSREIVFGIK